MKKIKHYLTAILTLGIMFTGSSLLFTTPVSAVTQAECQDAGGVWVPRSGANPYTDTCNYPNSGGNTDNEDGADAGGGCSAPTILTFPVWYRGVVDSDCNVNFYDPTDIWIVVLNVIEILVQLAGYLAAVYIIIGGFKYLTSAGSPDTISSAGNTIRNAAIGLIIALAAVAIVRFISGGIN